MKLWHLYPRPDVSEATNPWEPWYDKVFNFVIRVETEEEARRIAHENGCDENRDQWRGNKFVTPWLDVAYSVCEELTADGAQGVVVRDLWSA